MFDSFLVDIIRIFSENTWEINVMNNSITSQGIGNYTLTIMSTKNAPLVIKGQIIVLFISSCSSNESSS